MFRIYILGFTSFLLLSGLAYAEGIGKPSVGAKGIPGATGTFEFKPSDWIEGETTWWVDSVESLLEWPAATSALMRAGPPTAECSAKPACRTVDSSSRIPAPMNSTATTTTRAIPTRSIVPRGASDRAALVAPVPRLPHHRALSRRSVPASLLHRQSRANSNDRCCPCGARGAFRSTCVQGQVVELNGRAQSIHGTI